MNIFQNLENKFVRDSIWLYASFFIFVVCGFCINLFILFYFSLEDLGIFVQIYTIYLIWSQFSVFGINDSAQRNIAYYVQTKAELVYIKLGALTNGFILGTIFSFLLFTLGDIIGEIVQSISVGLGIKLISPAILFFTLNKISLGIFNGERKIALYSIFQCFRSLLILLAVVFISLKYPSVYHLAYAFLISELVLFIFLSFYLGLTSFLKLKINKIKHWTKFHLVFGFKSFPIGFFYESNLKIDILMISFFLSDYKVGIYSFVAMFFEGVYQVPHLIKINFNPILVSILKKHGKIKFDKFIINLISLSIFVTLFCTLAITVIYPLLDLYFPNNIINETYLIMIVLFIGLFFYSGFMPLDFVFLQAGRPEIQTLFLFLNVLINVALNFVLIPKYGLYGAAMSTSLALILAGLNLIVFMVYTKLISVN